MADNNLTKNITTRDVVEFVANHPHVITELLTTQPNLLEEALAAASYSKKNNNEVNPKVIDLTPALAPTLPLTIDRRNKANRVSHGLNYWPFTQDDFIHQPCISYRYLRPAFMLGKLKKCIKSIYSRYQVLAISMRKD